MTDLPDPEAERLRIQRSRNIVLALTLGFFVILVYAISFTRMG